MSDPNDPVEAFIRRVYDIYVGCADNRATLEDAFREAIRWRRDAKAVIDVARAAEERVEREREGRKVFVRWLEGLADKPAPAPGGDGHG